ncbi:AraC family transcriptional regulator, partial [Stenotrophomonas sp. MB339]
MGVAQLRAAARPARQAVTGQVGSGARWRAGRVLLDWLRAHYDGGSLLAADSDGVGVLARAGLLAGRTVRGSGMGRDLGLQAQAVSWVPSERAVVDEVELVTVGGAQGWGCLRWRLLVRSDGQGRARIQVIKD